MPQVSIFDMQVLCTDIITDILNLFPTKYVNENNFKKCSIFILS